MPYQEAEFPFHTRQTGAQADGEPALAGCVSSHTLPLGKV